MQERKERKIMFWWHR